MWIAFVILGVVILGIIISFTNNSVQNAKVYGPPRTYLSDIIYNFDSQFPSKRTLIENKGRYKTQYLSQSFDLTVDFIYLPDKIQTTLTFNSIIGKRMRVFNCPYNTEIIENEISEKYKELIGFTA